MGKITELNDLVEKAGLKKIMDMQYGRSGYTVSVFTNKNGSKTKAIFSGFAEKENNGEYMVQDKRRWLPEITQEFRRRMESTGDGQTRWNSRELKTKDYRDEDIMMGEKLNADRMIKQMIKAIKDEDEKKLLQFMKKDKKGFFNKRNLDFLVDDEEISREEASKLSKLSIGVAHALDANTADKDMRQKKLAMAMDRVKEVE